MLGLDVLVHLKSIENIYINIFESLVTPLLNYLLKDTDLLLGSNTCLLLNISLPTLSPSIWFKIELLFPAYFFIIFIEGSFKHERQNKSER